MREPATALITGASSGIGMELAREHARRGGHMILVARRTDKLEDLKRELSSEYPDVRIDVLTMDLSEPRSASRLAGWLQEMELTIDILINNAGFGVFGPFKQSQWRLVERMLHLNIITLTELTHTLLPEMIQRGTGRILNVASTAAFQPGPNFASYYASKAYVLHFSEAIAHELRGTGVTVTALCPGPTKSEFQTRANMGKVLLFDRFPLPSSADVAIYGYRKMLQGKRVAVHGFANRVTAYLVRLIPKAVILPIVERLQLKRT